jgi:hypothetical protein
MMKECTFAVAASVSQTSPPLPPTPKPKPTPRKTSADCAQETSASSTPDNNTVIYAMPFNRPPVALVPNSAPAAAPARKTSAADTRKPSVDTNPYSEVEAPSTQSPLKLSSKNLDYEYADPDANDKWLLQSIARGASSDYAEINCTDRTYAEISNTDGTYSTISESGGRSTLHFDGYFLCCCCFCEY